MILHRHYRNGKLYLLIHNNTLTQIDDDWKRHYLYIGITEAGVYTRDHLDYDAKFTPVEVPTYKVIGMVFKSCRALLKSK